MKKLLLSVFIAAVISGCGNKDVAQGGQKDTTAVTLASVTIPLPSAKCAMCKKTVKNAVLEAGFASDVKFDGEAPAYVATVSFDPSKTSEKAICEAIGKAGYNVKGVVRDSAAYENLHECCK